MSTIKTLDVKVSGLYPNKKYRFNFTNKGGNWPVRVSPLSGIAYPNSVKTYVYFCSTTGECPSSDPNVFFNTPTIDPSTPGLALDNKSLYSILELSVKEFDCDTVVITHPCIVECDECIPQLNISADSISLETPDSSESTFSCQVDGLVPNQLYKYQFSGLESNWPIKIIPRSGVIQTSNSSYNINGLVSVCESSTMCPSGSPNVLNYTTSSDSDLLYSLIELSVEPIDTINSNFQASSKSTFSVLCKGCLPMNQLDINFSGAPLLNLSDCACSGSRLVSVSVTGARPYDTYNYVFSSSTNNITFTPSSGTTIFSNAGSGDMMTIMNLALASGDQSIIKLQLNDNYNRMQAIDYLAIKCSGSCT